MSNAKRMALPGLFVALFALALAPALMSPGPAVAQVTPQRADLFGTGLQQGDVVAALIDGVVCDTYTVTAEDGGAWAIVIPSGSCGGGAVAGAQVTITVNGATADQVVTWSDGYFPADRANGITLTFAGSSVPADPVGPPLTATLSRTEGLAIFSGGSLDEFEAVALAACPGGVTIWANAPGGGGYLPFVPDAPLPLVNAAFNRAYAGGFDGPEPVIVNLCKQ
jgi:hypothetical protein